MTRAEVIDKVKKLLRLAKSAGTEAEAINAAGKAQEIITRYGLSDDDVSDLEVDGNIIDGAKYVIVLDRKSLTVWEQALAATLGPMCGCYAYKCWLRGQFTRIHAVGRTRDLQVFATLLPAMCSTVRSLTRKRAVEAKRLQMRFSPASYSMGVVTGMLTRMQHAQNDVIDEVRRAGSTALAPVSRAEEAKSAAMQARPNGFKPAKIYSRDDGVWFRHGFRDGMAVKPPGEHRPLAPGSGKFDDAK